MGRYLWLLLPLLLLAGCKDLEQLQRTPPSPYTVLDARGRLFGNFDRLLDQLARKRVVYVGETHTNYGHHLLELAVIRGLKRRGVDFAVGMEFFQKPYQKWLDDYIAGRVDERLMLEKTQWFDRWRFDYRLYRPILRYAREQGIPLVALNVRREITDAVSKKGIGGLNKKERSALPATIDRSDKAYRNRLHMIYAQHMGGHAGGFQRFLDVQYSWDESMAQSVARYLQTHPKKHMVVLAGSGHLAWGSGIPKRVARRIPVTSAIVLAADPGVQPGMADYLVVPERKKLPPRPLMGVMIDSSGHRLRITGVTPDSGAQKAGLRKGDLLVALDGRPISSYGQLRIALLEHHPGDRVKVKLRRDGRLLERTLVLGAAPH